MTGFLISFLFIAYTHITAKWLGGSLSQFHFFYLCEAITINNRKT
jgi:hypothetical protein